MSSKQWTSMELARLILRQYEQGSSVKEIAEARHMSRQGVYNAIRLAGGTIGRKPPKRGLLAWLDQ